HQRDENAGTLMPSSAATESPRRPSERTVTSDCLSRASSTSASHATVATLPSWGSTIGIALPVKAIGETQQGQRRSTPPCRFSPAQGCFFHEIGGFTRCAA